LAVCREIFTNFIQASEILGVDKIIRKECKQALPKIHPYRIGKDGILQEYKEDHEDLNPGHRHISHLYPVYPGYEITPYTKPELAEAARQSVLRRRTHVDGAGYVGWSRAWFLNILARLQDPEPAHEEAKILISKCTYPNMLGTHQMGRTNPDKAVNCIDGNFGYTAGIAELLLQSHLGNVHLLPSLPKEKWPNGFIKGVKARGGYTVDIEWKQGKLTRAIIKSVQDGTCTILYDGKEVEMPVNKGQTYVLDGNLTLTGNFPTESDRSIAKESN
jgi:alpha-L-fucosidase 2